MVWCLSTDACRLSHFICTIQITTSDEDSTSELACFSGQTQVYTWEKGGQKYADFMNTKSF